MPEAAPSTSPPPVRRAVWWLGLAGCAVIAIAATALAYASGLPALFDDVPYLDKVAHFAIFGSVAFFLDGVLRRRSVGRRVPLAAVLVLVPAGIEEALQRFSVNRSSDPADYLADVAGVFFFVWLSRRLS
jgi:VanZ family protein